jgi:hypothetical protein
VEKAAVQFPIVLVLEPIVVLPETVVLAGVSKLKSGIVMEVANAGAAEKLAIQNSARPVMREGFMAVSWVSSLVEVLKLRSGD